MKKIIRKILVSLTAIILLPPFLLFTLFLRIIKRDYNLIYSEKTNIIEKYYIKYKKWIFNNWKEWPLIGCDGPYIFTKDRCIEEINVIKGDNDKYLLHRKIHDSIPNQFLCQVYNEDRDNFYFSLHNETIIDSSRYDMPSKMIAISDIEGNFNGFYSFLLSNKVIDKKYDWTFDDGHLVLLGDFMDRGKNVIQVLWLIYKLEQEALKFGGKVHFLLGNHEAKNIYSELHFADSNYRAIAQRYANKKRNMEAYRELLKNNILFDWVTTKNMITIIGNNLFVHGGISPELFDANLSIDYINDYIRKNEFNEQIHDLIFGTFGPLWYRGMVEGRKYKKTPYSKVSENHIDKVLERFQVEKIIVGHSPVSDISYDHDCKVLRIDVIHGTDKFSGKTKGVLFENSMIYKINDLGEKFDIEMIKT